MSESRQPERLAGGGLMLALLAAFIIVMAAMKLDRPLSRADAGAALAAWPDMRIDVNSANEAELQLLPGIGARLAERIVEERQARGPFRTVDELMRVRGVGPATLDQFRTFAFVEAAEGAESDE